MTIDVENFITIIILLILISIYVYLLCDNTNTNSNNNLLLKKYHPFVIPDDTKEHFAMFLKDTSIEQNQQEADKYWEQYPYKEQSKTDDFFLQVDPNEHFQHQQQQGEYHTFETNIPSKNFHCNHELEWLLIRCQMNYKFLWMHTSNLYMSASGTADTPLHHRSFKISTVSIQTSCKESDGWILLQEGDSEGFIYMALANETDAYTIQIGSNDVNIARNDIRYHFLLEVEGYILNRGTMGFLNAFSGDEYPIRGYSSWDKTKPSNREYTSIVQFEFINSSLVIDAIKKEAIEEKESIEEDQKYIQIIQKLPKSNEKRVISYGLYGSNKKYTIGAIHNIAAAKIYFPRWICRFYVTEDVPKDIIEQIKDLGGEVEAIPPGQGYISGMFWRFMVAVDPTVDRYIIRDADSRMNSRERMAVEEWIESKYPIHIIRDHVNHCLVMNGGMWGGIKGAIPSMKADVESWNNKDVYSADLNFLEEKIWPEIRDKQIAHDSYCCDRFPNARPFPTKRLLTYQHVGQVFDAEDHPRLNDIDGYIRGVPVPGSCRKHADWIYG